MGTYWLHNVVGNKWYAAKHSLAAGGQATVFDGLDGALPVAIKVIRQSSDIIRDRRVWEAERSVYQRCVGHPYIVAIIDHFISPANDLVLVMERASGNAQQIIERGVSYSPQQVCLIGAQLASALEHVHCVGVIHRDVTLRNVLRFPGDVFKLGDFGISRADLLPGELARTMIAAPGYLPPELLRDGSFTRQSDIYQLGIVLLSLLLGRQVAPRGNVNQAILAAEPRLAAERAVASYGRTAEIIQWMLPRTPEKRIQTAEAVRLAFHAEYDRLNAQGRAVAIARKPTFNPLPAASVSPLLQALARNRFAALPRVPANPLPQALACNGINPLPKLPEGKELSARSRAQDGIGLFALPRMPARNGLLAGVPNPPLRALARNRLPAQPPLSALAAKGIGLEREPPLLGLGLGQAPLFPQPPENGMLGLAAIARGVNPNPPMMPPVKPNVALGGLLGLGSLAALAAGQKPLSGLLGLGALAALASDPNAKSSS